MKNLWGIKDDDTLDAEEIKKELGINRDFAIKTAEWFEEKRIEALEGVLGEIGKSKTKGLTNATLAADRYMGIGIKMHAFLADELPGLAEDFSKKNPKMTPGMMDAMCKLITAHVLKALIEGADELKEL